MAVHCLKSVPFWSYSGPYFPTFGLNTERYRVSLRIQSGCGKIRSISPYSVRMGENTDQNNSEYGHFLHSGNLLKIAFFRNLVNITTSNIAWLYFSKSNCNQSRYYQVVLQLTLNIAHTFLLCFYCCLLTDVCWENKSLQLWNLKSFLKSVCPIFSFLNIVFVNKHCKKHLTFCSISEVCKIILPHPTSCSWVWS